MSFASAEADYLDPDKYFRGQEEAEIAKVVQTLLDALEKADEGRNGDCWPIISFGWKDADLHAEGCTGIREVIRADEESVTFRVGGHKTLCDPTYECEYDLSKEDEADFSASAHGIVCDQSVGTGEWTGDDWSLSWDGEIDVVFPEGELDNAWKEEAVKRTLEAARNALAPFERDMAFLSEQMDRLYGEMHAKYQWQHDEVCPEWS